MQNLIIRKCLDSTLIMAGIQEYFSGLLVTQFNEAGREITAVSISYNPMKGDFCGSLDIFTKEVFDIEELAFFCAKKWKTDIVMGNNEINPFTWILVNPLGEQRTINQVPGEGDEFIIENI